MTFSQGWRVNLVLLCLALCSEVVSSQTIVNTETLLAHVDSGWVATFGLAGDLSFGNSRVTDVGADGSVGYRRGSSMYRLAGSWARLAEGGVPIQANRFVQARVNRDVGSGAWQVFGFVQSASNNVLLIQERTLLGLGLRGSLVRGNDGWLDVAWGPFLEREVYNTELGEPEKSLARSSVTISSRWKLSQNLLWRNTVYVQSAFSDFSDTRLFFESAANVPVSSSISIEFDFILRRDSQPHGGLAPIDAGTVFGLRWAVE